MSDEQNTDIDLRRFRAACKAIDSAMESLAIGKRGITEFRTPFGDQIAAEIRDAMHATALHTEILLHKLVDPVWGTLPKETRDLCEASAKLEENAGNAE
jgi:hypothetical protein